jgi:hypothetical protein
MSKYSSFKEHQLITENWRKFLTEEEVQPQLGLDSPEVLELASQLFRKNLAAIEEPNAERKELSEVDSDVDPDLVATQKTEPVSVPTEKDLRALVTGLAEKGVAVAFGTTTVAGGVAGAFKWMEYFSTHHGHTDAWRSFVDAVVALITSPIGAGIGAGLTVALWAAAAIAVTQSRSLLGLLPPEEEAETAPGIAR